MKAMLMGTETMGMGIHVMEFRMEVMYMGTVIVEMSTEMMWMEMKILLMGTISAVVMEVTIRVITKGKKAATVLKRNSNKKRKEKQITKNAKHFFDQNLG